MEVDTTLFVKEHCLQESFFEFHVSESEGTYSVTSNFLPPYILEIMVTCVLVKSKCRSVACCFRRRNEEAWRGMNI